MVTGKQRYAQPRRAEAYNNKQRRFSLQFKMSTCKCKFKTERYKAEIRGVKIYQVVNMHS